MKDYKEILDGMSPQEQIVVGYLLTKFNYSTNISIEYLHKIKAKYPEIVKPGYNDKIPEDVMKYVIGYNIECFKIDTILDMLRQKYEDIANLFINPKKIKIQ